MRSNVCYALGDREWTESLPGAMGYVDLKVTSNPDKAQKKSHAIGSEQTQRLKRRIRLTLKWIPHELKTLPVREAIWSRLLESKASSLVDC